jgi:hypothetical protein
MARQYSCQDWGYERQCAIEGQRMPFRDLQYSQTLSWLRKKSRNDRVLSKPPYMPSYPDVVGVRSQATCCCASALFFWEMIGDKHQLQQHHH